MAGLSASGEHRAPPTFRGAVLACRLGMFVQALVANLTPLLFVPLRDHLHLSWEQLGRLVLVNFTTQFAVDLIAAPLAARFGLRAPLVAAHALAAAGIGCMCLASLAPEHGYTVLLIGTVVFSSGCGLLEVFLSPVLNAIPSERKACDMALLHAFYPLGKLAVVIGTALALALAGSTNWPGIALAWIPVPALGAWAFLRVALPALPTESERQRVRQLAWQPSFQAVLLAMALAGASELAIAQWTSAYVQRGLGMSQGVGDLVGFGVFALGMAAGRFWYGLKGDGSDLPRLLLRSGLASTLAYLVAALSPWTTPALMACSLAGLAVGMLWPATLSLAGARWPAAGATVYALLAAAGDAGGALAAWSVGLVADLATAHPGLVDWLPGPGSEARGLQAGMLLAGLSPLAMVVLAWKWRLGSAAPRSN